MDLIYMILFKLIILLHNRWISCSNLFIAKNYR
jgi:hypothetical protein